MKADFTMWGSVGAVSALWIFMTVIVIYTIRCLFLSEEISATLPFRALLVIGCLLIWWLSIYQILQAESKQDLLIGAILLLPPIFTTFGLYQANILLQKDILTINVEHVGLDTLSVVAVSLASMVIGLGLLTSIAIVGISAIIGVIIAFLL
ncbi:MAG: hypothetical protein DSY33_04145 [Archaeoglobus sp.]|nr:MAG: hypothetical protein DSY33_04145 [Archaeoglobus sp.]